MDRLEGMRVFVAVVEAGGFSAASRSLKMPLPTVSRKIAQLESHLGAQLLLRSTRSVIATETGQQFYEAARRLLEEVEDAERQASGEFRSPKGRLTITAPLLFGRLHVLPIANEFARLHENISISMALTNDVVDYLDEQINLGLRIGPLTDSTMIAAGVGHMRQVICASPSYIAKHGSPNSPDDLRNHLCISSSRMKRPNVWPFKMPSGQIRTIEIDAKSTFNSIEAIVDWATMDGGLAALYAYQAASKISKGALQTVLDRYEPDPAPVSFVYPQGKQLAKKVRSFIDFARPLLRERLVAIDKLTS